MKKYKHYSLLASLFITIIALFIAFKGIKFNQVIAYIGKGRYFIFYKNLPKYLLKSYGLSYFLVGVFFPLPLISRILPFKEINIYLGNTMFTMGESYKAYCMPLLGVILLALFFIILWHNRKILETSNL